MPEDRRATDAEAGAAARLAPYLVMVLVLALLTVLVFWGYARWLPMAGRAGRTKTAEALGGAVSALRTGDLAQAEKLRAEAGRRGDNTTLGSFLDGVLAGRSGTTPGARVARRLSAAEKGRGGVLAQVTLGGYKSAKGDAAGSADALEKALARRPGDNGLALLTLAQLLDARRFEQAIKEADALEERTGPMPALNEIRGRAYVALGQADRAAAEFRAGISQAPRSVSMVLGAADALLRKGDTAGALELAASALRVDPKSADAHYCYGLVQQQMGARSKAETYYRAALKLNPDHSRTLNNLAYLLADDKARVSEALELAQKAYALAPSPAVADTLGWCYVQAGEAAKGLPLLEAAAKALPRERDVAQHLSAARQRKAR